MFKIRPMRKRSMNPRHSKSAVKGTTQTFLRTFGELNGELDRILKLYKSNQASYTEVQAAAYNLFCFIQDNQQWIEEAKETIDPENLAALARLLRITKKQSHEAAIDNYTSALWTIHTQVTNFFNSLKNK